MQIRRCPCGLSVVTVLVGALILLCGCGAQEGPPEKPVVVRKVISSPASQPAVITASVMQKEAAVSSNSERVHGKAPAVPDTAGAAIAKESDKPPADEFPPLYSPEGKIDPFTPLIKEKSEGKGDKREKVKRVPQTPLETMDLSQMKLTAIIVAPKGNRALVEEPTGKGYIISEGTYVGLNSGIVTEISKDCVIVQEELEDIFGKIKRESKELKLQKNPGDF